MIKGWRRFGLFFFKPKCDPCFKCTPIRVRVDDFKPTKSQIRVINKNKETKVVFNKLKFKNEMYEIYKEHSQDRFNQPGSIEDFISSFFFESSFAYQSEYYINDKLIGFGFIDVTNEGISSIYFVYKTKYNVLSLGTFSILKEIEYAKNLGLKYLYLGYLIKENHSMAYKENFKPHDLYDWQKECWIS